MISVAWVGAMGSKRLQCGRSGESRAIYKLYTKEPSASCLSANTDNLVDVDHLNITLVGVLYQHQFLIVRAVAS